MKLITREIELKLKKNAALPEAERVPVLKLFGGGACTWLISEKEGRYSFRTLRSWARLRRAWLCIVERTRVAQVSAFWFRRGA
jgi:hypothetical protein